MDRSKQGQAPYGYRWRDGKLHQLPEEAETRSRAFHLVLELRSMGAIAKALNEEKRRTRRGGLWSDVQVARILECASAVGRYAIRSKALGSQSFTESVVECEPLISQELWDRVEKLLAARRKVPAEDEAKIPMAGLVRCACGQGMRFVAATEKLSCAHCSSRITIEDLEAIFVEDFCEFIASHPLLANALAIESADRNRASEIALLETERERLEKELAAAEGMFQQKGITFTRLEELRRPLDAGRAEATRKLIALKETPTGQAETPSPQAWAQAWPNLPRARRRKIITTFVSCFVVGDGEVEITYLLQEPSAPPKDESVSQQTSAPTYHPKPGDPVYIRLPKQGDRCAHTGLSRAKLNELILPNERNGFAPPVKSKSLRQQGAQRGIRLVMLESLMAYLSGKS